MPRSWVRDRACRRRGSEHLRLGDVTSACDGAVVGMTGYGASAPADKLYAHFGITASAVADAALARL